MSAYDKEYFYSFNDYQNIMKNQPVALSSWGDVKFDFYEMRFGNGVVVYLLNTLKETSAFKAYCSLPADKVPYIGSVKEIEDRIIFEAINRNNKDFNSLCTELAEGKEFCFLYVPFDFSWQKNPAKELA